MLREATEISLLVLKESNKSRFDCFSRYEQCIDHIPYYLSGWVACTFPPTTFLETAVYRVRLSFVSRQPLSYWSRRSDWVLKFIIRRCVDLLNGDPSSMGCCPWRRKTSTCGLFWAFPCLWQSESFSVTAEAVQLWDFCLPTTLV